MAIAKGREALERLPSRYNLMMHMHYNEWPRLSMFMCVAASMSVGVMVTKGLLALGVMSLWARWLPALAAAYLAFFAAIWLWLHLSRYGRHFRARAKDRRDFGGDVGSGGPPGGSSGGAHPDPVPSIDGGGGSFDGGGADADFSGGMTFDSPSLDFGGGPDIGFDLPDEGGLVAILGAILLMVAAFALVGGAIYVVYEAPAILTEVVFEVLLASSLVRRSRAAMPGDWAAALLRRTWKPFAWIGSVALSIALLAGLAAPEAHTARDLIHSVFHAHRHG